MISCQKLLPSNPGYETVPAMRVLFVSVCLSLEVAYRLHLAIEVKEGCGLEQTLIK